MWTRIVADWTDRKEKRQPNGQLCEQRRRRRRRRFVLTEALKSPGTVGPTSAPAADRGSKKTTPTTDHLQVTMTASWVTWQWPLSVLFEDGQFVRDHPISNNPRPQRVPSPFMSTCFLLSQLFFLFVVVFSVCGSVFHLWLCFVICCWFLHFAVVFSFCDCDWHFRATVVNC